MLVETVSTTDGALLRAVRRSLSDVDDALLCVAFASEQGVHLLAPQLKALRGRGRLLVTTAFGSTTTAALLGAHAHGLRVSLFNPGGGTYHPKLYIGRRGDRLSAVIGSVNMTGGLVNNVELGTHLTGTIDDPPLAKAWAWAEQTWSGPSVQPWVPDEATGPEHQRFAEELVAWIEAETRRDPVFMTLGKKPMRNIVTDVTDIGLYVETDKCRREFTGPQLVPASMIELAWDYLRAHGRLTNRFLLNELRVHRSSFVCALLARHPLVEVVSGKGIELVWRG